MLNPRQENLSEDSIFLIVFNIKSYSNAMINFKMKMINNVRCKVCTP